MVTVYSCIFVTQITHKTSATRGKRTTSKSRNNLHADENINTSKHQVSNRMRPKKPCPPFAPKQT